MARAHRGLSRDHLLTTAIAASSIMGWPARAQGTADTPPDADIVVTGSRIPRPETDSPSPVVAYTSAAIEESGRTNVVEILSDAPALLNSASSRGTFGVLADAPGAEGGLSTLNLRGLGDNRTLTLVNGRRHVAGSTASAAVDINTIPTDLIDRVDIVTGGASAVYGADAVSGVVNFILKKDFQGLLGRARVGISDEGDAGQRFLSLTGGANFAGGRGNVAASFEYTDYDPLFGYQRRFTNQATGIYRVPVRNPADLPDDPNIPDYIYVLDNRINNGAVSGGYDTGGPDANGTYTPGLFDGIADFTGNGAVFDHGSIPNDYLTSGGNGTPSLTLYTYQLQSAEQRRLANLTAHFDASAAVNLFVEGKFARTDVANSIYTTYDVGNVIGSDNPFIPAPLRAAIDPAQGLVLGERDNLDLGYAQVFTRRETLRGVAGSRGRLADWLSYEGSFVYGQTDVRRTVTHDRYQDRFLAAIDVVTDPATGQPICRSDLFPATATQVGSRLSFTPGRGSGCVPYNIFGDDVASQAAKDWVTLTTRRREKVTQKVADLTFTGTLDPLFRPGAGSIGFALGAEYRREAISLRPDAATRDNLGFPDFGSGTQAQRGAFSVKEAFGELNIPILADRPVFNKLILSLAGRYSDYSTSGGSTAWNVDLLYSPLPGLTLRGTLSKSVRAPNLIEAFQASSVSRQFVNDPCDIGNLNNGTQYRVANCRMLLTGLGVDPATFQPNATNSGVPISALTSGNSDLKPETAHTWTAGIALDRFPVRGLSISLDWYNVQLEGAIGTVDPLNNCVDSPTLDNQYCPVVSRDAATGVVQSYLIRPVNIASFKTSGADLTINYALATRSAGKFTAHVVAGYLRRLTFENALAGQPIEQAGYNVSKYSVDTSLNWTIGRASLNYALAWLSRRSRVDRLTLIGDPDYYASDLLNTKERWIHDVQVTYDVDDRFALFAGVNDLTDQKTSLRSNNVTPVGRFFFVGAKVRVR